MQAIDDRHVFVPETRFGVCFLGTETWRIHVLRHALNDLERMLRPRAAGAIARCPVPVEWHSADAAHLPLADESVDLGFCRQTLHHVVAQSNALAEFFRVLRPDGVPLMGESTSAYIRSWLIRLLFRHPMHVQRTADEYIAMVRRAGFDVRPERVSLPFLWWNRRDLGFREWIGLPVPARREETLVNLVTFKPGGCRARPSPRRSTP